MLRKAVEAATQNHSRNHFLGSPTNASDDEKPVILF